MIFKIIIIFWLNLLSRESLIFTINVGRPQQKTTKTMFLTNQKRKSKGKMINLNNLSINIIILTRNLSRGLPKLTNSPILTYNNAEELKSLIFKENLNKSFVYRWTNKVNGKTYLGSTSNAKSRLQTYYDNYTLNLINMPIYKAILKYGHSNFILDIIEYCDSAETIQKEQYYLDRFDFDYNILEKANSSLGYKHNSQTIKKMKGRQNFLGYKHTEETKDKLRELQTNKKYSVEDLEKMREIWAKRKFNSLNTNLQDLNTKTIIETESEGYVYDFVDTDQKLKLQKNRKKIKGKIVVVTNIKSNVSTEYISISEAASYLNITRTTLRTYMKNKTVLNILKQNPSGYGIMKEQFIINVKGK